MRMRLVYRQRRRWIEYLVFPGERCLGVTTRRPRSLPREPNTRATGRGDSLARLMRARIHRGATEVGGTCVELETEGHRLVLDVGLPLATDQGQEVPLPRVSGLTGGDTSIAGVVLSHAHPDHYGLVDRIGPEVPIYAGSATVRILREAAFFTRSGAEITVAGELRDRAPLQLGPFVVTPFLVDHSAFDSYAILVEADGRRLFYT